MDVWHVQNTSGRNGLLTRMQSQMCLVSTIQCLPLICIAGVEFPHSSFQRTVVVQGVVCAIIWEYFCCEFPVDCGDRTVLYPGLGLGILPVFCGCSWEVMGLLGYCGAAQRVRVGRMASDSNVKPVLHFWLSALMSLSASSPVLISSSMTVFRCPLMLTLLCCQNFAPFLIISPVDKVIEIDCWIKI